MAISLYSAYCVCHFCNHIQVYTWVILLINPTEEIGEKQLLVLAPEGTSLPLNARSPFDDYVIKAGFHRLWLTCILVKVRKRAKFRNRYNQAPHLTQVTNGKATTSQLEITNESQEVRSFPAGDHKASTNRRAWKHNKIRQNKLSTKEAPPWNGQ